MYIYRCGPKKSAYRMWFSLACVCTSVHYDSVYLCVFCADTVLSRVSGRADMC